MLQAPLYFEDVEVGYKFQSPGGRTITNAEVVNFAQITGDYNLVHLDTSSRRPACTARTSPTAPLR